MLDDIQIQKILSLLATDDPESIREGAQLAGKNRLTEAVPHLVKHALSRNIGVQEAVDRALRKIGGKEVAHAVIPMLRSDDAPVRNLAMDLLRSLGSADIESLYPLLQDADADMRIFAADILGSTGTVLAVPPLCRALLHDPEVNVRYQAAVSLGALAFSEAVPSLNKALKDEEWVQFAVIEALTNIRDESSVGAMINALGQASDLVASTLVDAVGEMGNIKAVPLLLKRLQSSPTALRSKIARAVICIMGEHSLSLIGAKECELLRASLICALEDEDPQIQDAAVKGLAALGGQGITSSILALVMRLDAEKDEERIANAIKALSKLADVPELEKTVLAGNEQATRIALSVLLQVDEARGVALMVDIFWQQSRDVQRDMMTALADCAGSEYQNFFLDTLERHDDGSILRGALLFLSRHSDADAVFDKIIPLLSHPYDDVRQAALEACIFLHSAAVEQHFRQMASDPDPTQRAMGVYGLGFFDLSHSVSELKAALGDESPDVRKVAAGAFGQHFPIQAEYLPLLEEAGNDEHWEVRMAVFATLGRCFEKSFIPYFLKGLNDEEPWVRVRCVECLGEHKVSQAVEPLLRLLHEENSLIVLKAIEALGKIGGEAAFRALLPVLEHRDRDIQAAAEQALNAIHSQAGE